MEAYIKIKDKKISVAVRSYKNSKTIKIFFKGNILNVTKPNRVSINEVVRLLNQNEDSIYSEYMKVISSKSETIKQWQTGEKIYYKGIEFSIKRKYINEMTISVRLELDTKQMIIMLPESIQEYEIKESVDKAIKKLLKNNTQCIINQKLPYWSEKTGIKYNEVKIRDATSRYGSCIPTKKNIYFSSRLIMLPEHVVDAIIVHELCHIIYKNHNNEFYELVQKYVPEYKEIDKWLKENGKIIMF